MDFPDFLGVFSYFFGSFPILAHSNTNNAFPSFFSFLLTSKKITQFRSISSAQETVYHNEAYRNSDDSSPESEQNRTLKPKNAPPNRNHSLITAIINAIRDAAHTAKIKVNQRFDAIPNGDMLDSETEPCLMMENVLDEAIGSDPPSNEAMTTASADTSSEADRTDDSLHNLCEAIANRRKIEEQSWSNGSYENARLDNLLKIQQNHQQQYQQTFVDQVIAVDNLVTRLLKVLRIIQMDNDSCIQQLINEK